MSEIPVHFRPRKLSDWINPTGAKKVHSLMDKVYKRKNLEMAWEKVRSNRGRRWEESGTVRCGTGSAVRPVAHRTQRRHLSATTGAAGADPERGKPGRVSHAGSPNDL